jgi:signal transduction histidine kinase
MKGMAKALRAGKRDDNGRSRELQDSLVQMMVHDFRNPLTSAIGYIELMDFALEEGKYDECKTHLKFMSCMMNRINSMINDLLDLGRMEESGLPMSFERVALREIVDENLKENDIRLVDKDIKTMVGINGPAALVSADRRLMFRVVGNILSNAIRYSPNKGVIAFDIREDGGHVELAVSNQGPKLPEHALSRIFEKFYQVHDGVKSIGSGTGLGLAFCRMVVEAHSGSIRAVNNEGAGCTFIIRLPRGAD